MAVAGPPALLLNLVSQAAPTDSRSLRTEDRCSTPLADGVGHPLKEGSRNRASRLWRADPRATGGPRHPSRRGPWAPPTRHVEGGRSPKKRAEVTSGSVYFEPWMS